MATLAPGVLLKLLKGMNSGEKPTNKYRSSLLQITDIVPADLDEKNLLPKHGFYVKVSDSSHSIYVSLGFDQDDLVMSNKIQIGQFIYVEELEYGSPVPVVKGAKPLPGRHPLVGTPEPLMGMSKKGAKSEKRLDFCGSNRNSWELGENGFDGVLEKGGKSEQRLDFCCNNRRSWEIESNVVDGILEKGEKRLGCYSNKRSSWENGQNGVEKIDSHRTLKPVALDFDQFSTPVKSARNFPMSPGGRLPPRDGGLNGGARASAGGGVLEKMRVDMREDSPAMVRKSCVTTPSKALKLTKSKSECERREQRISKCSSNSTVGTNEKRSFTPPPNTRRAKIAASPGGAEKFYNSGLFSHSPSDTGNNTPVKGISLHMLLPGKLSILAKEAVQQREIAQKIASQAVRDASATEHIVRALKKFSSVSKSAEVDDPETSFKRFLEFHNQIEQSLRELASMQAAIAASELSQGKNAEGNSILSEINHNGMEHEHTSASKRKIGLLRPFASFSEKTGQKTSVLGKYLRSPSSNAKRRGGSDTDENKKPDCSSSSLQKSIDLGKQIKKEAGNWFMDFLEKYLEGVRKTRGRTSASAGQKVSQSLMLRVINWVEMEQCSSSSKIARKLRIKMKNP